MTASTAPQWTLQDRLRKARENAGLTQRDLADHLGIGRTTIANYEGGVTIPKRPVLLTWAMACGVPLSWLVGPEPTSPGTPRERRGPRSPCLTQTLREAA